MKCERWHQWLGLGCLLLALAGCGSQPARTPDPDPGLNAEPARKPATVVQKRGGAYYKDDGPADEIPDNEEGGGVVTLGRTGYLTRIDVAALTDDITGCDASVRLLKRVGDQIDRSATCRRQRVDQRRGLVCRQRVIGLHGNVQVAVRARPAPRQRAENESLTQAKPSLKQLAQQTDPGRADGARQL